MTCRSSRLPFSVLISVLAACGAARQPASPAPGPAPATSPASPAPDTAPASPAPPAAAGKRRPTEPGPHQTTYGVVFNFKPDGGSRDKQIHVAGNFNGWTPSDPRYRLTDDDGDGTWSVTVPLPAGTYQYKYVIDGTTWIQDPYAPSTAPDGFGGRNGQFDVQ